jgi:FMN phosphatase YigB (HAD superfamily)
LKENDLEGEECIYVDDSEENLEVAKELKIRGIKYESGEQVKETIIGMGVDPENRIPRG